MNKENTIEENNNTTNLQTSVECQTDFADKNRHHVSDVSNEHEHHYGQHQHKHHQHDNHNGHGQEQNQKERRKNKMKNNSTKNLTGIALLLACIIGLTANINAEIIGITNDLIESNRIQNNPNVINEIDDILIVENPIISDINEIVGNENTRKSDNPKINKTIDLIQISRYLETVNTIDTIAILDNIRRIELLR